MHINPLAGPRRRTRRALLAAALPVALAAVALPASADAGVIVLETNQLDYHDDTSRRQSVNAFVSGNSLRVRDFADGVRLTGPNNPCVLVTSSEASCPLSRVASIRGFLGAGDDSWISQLTIPTVLEGGAGGDEYVGGFHAGVSRVDFRGGSDTDRANYFSADGGVVLTKDEAANDGRTNRDGDNIRSDVEWLIGSRFNDSVNGGNGGVLELLEGGQGTDIVSGNGGANVYMMGSVADGADTIIGGPGSDNANYSLRTNPVIATLSAGDRNDGEAGEGDSLRSVEAISGGRAGDRLFAPAGSTVGYSLHGREGVDELNGAEGNDTLDAGPGQDSNLLAKGGNDIVFANDGESDVVGCGTGTDTAHLDNRDGFASCENRPVGKLRLSPDTVQAEAGNVARMRLSWRHPEGWRKLRKIELRLTRDGVPVGEIAIRPRGERIAADGAIELVRRHSRLTSKGKSVAARFALRLDESLAGQTLKAEVEATDKRGRRQLERDAGTVRVAR